MARERSLIELRKRHQIELKLKREDKMIQEQKDRDKKKANERALEKWYRFILIFRLYLNF